MGMTVIERKRRAALLLGAWAALQLAVNVAWAATRWERLGNPTLIDVMGDLGNLGAFNGIVVVVLMALLGSRNPSVERVFGLDKMMLLHRRLSLLSLGLFVAHAVLRTWSLSMQRGLVYDIPFLYRFSLAEWDMTLGRLALMLMLVATLLAWLGQKWMLVSFKAWKIPHIMLWAALPMGFVHGLVHGDDTRTMVFLPIWTLLFVVLLSDGARRLLFVLRRKRGHLWAIDERRQETRDTLSIFLDHPLAPGPFAERVAGQFGVLRVPGLAHMDEPHPFTFSGPAHHAGEKRLQVSVKVVGDFTAELVALPVGAHVLVEGPYGVFCADCAEKERLAFIAGGVGITPFLSVLRTLRVDGRDIPTTLIWTNKTRENVFAAAELAEMARVMPLTVHHVLSRESPDSLAGLSGGGVQYHASRLGNGVLEHCLGGKESYYLCGPEPMMQAVLKGLEDVFAIPARAVAREHFFW